MRRWPSLERAVGEYVEEMLDTRRCLVHGDFSPKNVLCGGEELWVLDFEVAHVGDPVFDLAFMLNHLMLKAIHRPAACEGYRDCAEAFLDAYARPLEEHYLLGHTGCLMAPAWTGSHLPRIGRRASDCSPARSARAALVVDPPAPVGRFGEFEQALRADRPPRCSPGGLHPAERRPRAKCDSRAVHPGQRFVPPARRPAPTRRVSCATAASATADMAPAWRRQTMRSAPEDRNGRGRPGPLDAACSAGSI
jgi:hypothetical protein